MMTPERTRVLVTFGGSGGEHEVSCASGNAVASALRSSGEFDVDVLHLTADDADALLTAVHSLKPDVVFPVFHGPWGEGGTVQQLLDSANQPFVGTHSDASRLAMDKHATKERAVEVGLDVIEGHVVNRSCQTPPWPAPWVLKPLDDGSSIDLFVCRREEDAHAAWSTYFERRERGLLERFVDGTELAVAMLDGETLPFVSIHPADGVYDYDAKYERGDTHYVTDPVIPDNIRAAAIDACRRLWKALNLRHLARVDFLIDGDVPRMLEVNTMPGFTATSLYPKAAIAAGMTFETLAARLVRSAVDDAVQIVAPRESIRR